MENLPAVDINPKTFLSKHCSLPALPAVLHKIQEIVQSEDANHLEVVNLINNDPLMVIQILKVVNSAYYSLPREMTNIRYAIAFLGLNEIYRMVLSISVVNTLSIDEEKKLKKFWFHSYYTAIITKHIAKKFESYLILEDLWAAAILHDIGKLVYLKFLPEHYKKITEFQEDKGCLFSEAEKYFDFPASSYLGLLLCDHWRLPDKVRIACECHTLEDLQKLDAKSSSGGFKRVVCLGNLIAIMSNNELNEDKKRGIADTIKISLELTEDCFLTLMGEIYELRAEVEQLMVQF